MSKPLTMAITHPIILDIEASGFGPTSYPIEIGVVLANKKNYCSLIKPADDWHHWSNQAEQVHGLAREILFQHGKQITIVINELNRFLEGQTVYSDGWVVDQPWLTRLYGQAHKNQTFCFSPLEMILNERQMECWHDTKDQVIAELALQRHRASSDAMIIQETYARTKLLSEIKV